MNTPFIRWLVRRDLEQVLEIEQLSFPYPWTEEEFIRVLRHKSVVGQCVEYEKQVVAYVIYELGNHCLEILNLAVHPSCWRRGFGSFLVDKLKSKLSKQKRPLLVAEVWERNVAAQLFFRSHGLRTWYSLRDLPYRGGIDERYVFLYEIGQDVTVAANVRIAN